MTDNIQYLSIVGHGTNGRTTRGEDDISRGIHLRLAFDSTIGVPVPRTNVSSKTVTSTP